MAFKVKVTYLDGKVEEVVPNPRARIETERHYQGLGQQNAQEATFYMAWAHLKKVRDVPPFEDWVDSLLDAEEKQIEDPRPTQPAQSAGTSSDSVSEQGSLPQP